MFRTVASRVFCAALAVIAVSAGAIPAHAGVDILTKPTQNMSCSADVCTPTAKKAYVNVNDLTNMLAAADVKITTGSGAEDIHIDAPFSWTSPSRLTLDAQRSIEFRASVTVAGIGGLTLVTNDGGTGGDYWFDPGASVSFWDRKSHLSINGQDYTLVKGIKTLAIDIAAHPSGNYALANSYDASADGTFAQPPVSVALTGEFEALGNTISNLTIYDFHGSRPTVGLFAQLGNGTGLGVIRDVRLENASATSNNRRANFAKVGALLGYNFGGVVANSYAKSKVTGAVNSTTAGGLVGQSSGGSAIINSGTSSEVSSGGDAGGLVGASDGSIVNSYSHGQVVGGGEAGGLVGEALGEIQNSYSDATVTVGGGVGGGLAAYAYSIVNSHAAGSVSATSGSGPPSLGGLAGITLNGLVVNSYATGAVSGGYWAGGLIGRALGKVDRSYATGIVSGYEYVGGLVGALSGYTKDYHEFGSIHDCYATGSASGSANAQVGGLIGEKDRHTPVSQSYSTGTSAGGSGASVGGFIGFDTHGIEGHSHIDTAYWDLDTSGVADPAQGAGNIQNDAGIVGLNDAQLKSALPWGFDPNTWGQNPKINNGYPYLLANPP